MPFPAPATERPVSVGVPGTTAEKEQKDIMVVAGKGDCVLSHAPWERSHEACPAGSHVSSPCGSAPTAVIQSCSSPPQSVHWSP